MTSDSALRAALERLLDTCGARGNSRAVDYMEACDQAEAALSTPAPASDAERAIEILRRALVWHGDPARMATTREDWQQEIDAAVAWVNAHPEEGRPSRPSLATAIRAGKEDE